MTKKHFIELADYLRLPGHVPAAIDRALQVYHDDKLELAQQLHGVILHEIAGELADFCKAQNHRFDRERWLGYIAGENGPNGGRVGK